MGLRLHDLALLGHLFLDSLVEQNLRGAVNSARARRSTFFRNRSVVREAGERSETPSLGSLSPLSPIPSSCLSELTAPSILTHEAATLNLAVQSLRAGRERKEERLKDQRHPLQPRGGVKIDLGRGENGHHPHLMCMAKETVAKCVQVFDLHFSFELLQPSTVRDWAAAGRAIRYLDRKIIFLDNLHFLF